VTFAYRTLWTDFVSAAMHIARSRSPPRWKGDLSDFRRVFPDFRSANFPEGEAP
jgi:hypothetical protein